MLFALLAAALADGASASAQKASVRELQARLGTGMAGPTGLTARLLWVLTQFPEPLGAQVVSWIWGKFSIQSGFIDYTLPGGKGLLLADCAEMGETPSEAMRRCLLQTRTPSTPRDAAIPVLVRWTWAQVRTQAPVKVRMQGLFATPARTDVLLDSTMAKQIAAFYEWNKERKRLDPSLNVHDPKDHAIRGEKWKALGLEEALGFATQYGQRMGTLFSNPLGLPGDERYPLTGEDLLLAAWFYVLAYALLGLLDWVGAHPAEADRLSLAEALQASRRWHLAQAKAARAGFAAEGTVVAVLPNGLGTIRELAPADLPAESRAMGHCVGDSPVYAEGIRQETKLILSVRDGAGVVQFTIEAGLGFRMGSHTPQWNILQMKGPKNRIPGLSVGSTRARPPGTIARTAEWLRENPKLVQRRDLAIGEAVLQALPSLGVVVEEDPRRASTGDLEVLYLARLGELPL